MCVSEPRSGEALTLGAMNKASSAQIGLDCFPGRGISETGFDAILASAKRVGGMTYEQRFDIVLQHQGKGVAIVR